MQFELSEALMDHILFSMEDQEGDFLIDTYEGMVVSREELEDADDERFMNLPEWDSSSGYRLMERFAAQFNNPLIRDRLCAALNRGRGVFRAFKDVLTYHPEAEKLWFAFKDRAMKEEILRWYNALREEWGLQRIGKEPEETGDLVLEDFRFREGRDGDTARALELHKLCLEEYRAGAGERIGCVPPAGETGSSSPPALVAETGGGEFAGYLSVEAQGDILIVTGLEVKPEYRGLGIGETLLVRFLETPALDFSQILLELPLCSEGFSRVLLREGFKSYLVRYCYSRGAPRR
jgi:ribosomal protein S18 acetylase RimI-like enzyme